MSATIPPVRTSVLVHRPREAVFTAFTAEIGRWWPVKAFSISEARAVRCGMELRAGGAVSEERDDGERLPWGTVLERHLAPWMDGGEGSTPKEAGDA